MGVIVDAKWAQNIPDNATDEGADHYRVGWDLRCHDGTPAKVTRITVQSDEPGLHGTLRRICVWVGPLLAVEFPYLNAGGVGYL